MQLLFGRKNLMKTGKLLLLFFLCIQIAMQAKATDDVERVTVFRGSHGELASPTEMETVDVHYYDPAWLTKITNPSKDVYLNTIALKVVEGGNVFVGQNFTCTVAFDLSWTDKNGVDHGPTNLSLTVTYNVGQGVKYDARSSYIFDNARKVKVKITSVSTGLPAGALQILRLENRMRIKRDFIFVDDALLFDPGANTNNELVIDWDADGSKGHTHFDIEWAWIDATARERYESGSALDPALVFKNNSSRVTIPAGQMSETAGSASYKIPLFYDDEGYLCYRIRPVQYAEDGNIYEGEWSTLKEYHYFNGYEYQLNWQATTTYAEDGKRKSVVQFYDGTLRSRQTVTKDNVTETTIVAETMYDYQGRPAINILPAPTINGMIGFAKNFNRFESADYPKDIYDKLPGMQALCEVVSPILDSTSGSSKYYSANNDLVNSGFHQYIPSAHGYPYSETQYTQDGTGRISLQGGVGPMFQINNKPGTEVNSKETRYFYGTPDQKELDALFGTEAGMADHYFKNMVRDANAQYSVSYIDMHGRTVATALAGVRPVNLDDVSERTQFMTRNLLGQSNNIVKDRSIVSSTSLLVPRTGLHEFHYELGPQSAEIQACNPPGQTVCYDCYYDLEVRITGSCLAEPIIQTKNDISFPLNTDCPTTPAAITLDFNVTLPEGEYNITKTLTLSKSAQDWYRENVFRQKNICKTLQNYFDEQYAIMIANSDCNGTNYSCSACMTNLGGSYEAFREQFLLEQGIEDPNTEVEYEAEIRQAYDRALEECEALCATNAPQNKLDLLYEIMLDDMIPGRGQYALLDEDINGNGNMNDVIGLADGQNGSINHGQYLYETNTNRLYNIFNPVGTQNPVRPYTVPRTTDGSILPYYPNETGNAADGELVPNPPAGQTDEDFNQFASTFQERWAENLIYYHPEYQRYKYAKEKLQTSYTRDALMLSIETWDEAVSQNFINNLLANDPFFSGTEGAKHDEALTMTYGQFMNKNLTQGYGTSGKTLWQLAWIAGNCPDPVSSACVNQPSTIPPFTFPAGCESDKNKTWQIFRNLYIAEKENLINAYLKRYGPVVNYDLIEQNHYQRRFGNVLDFDELGTSLPPSVQIIAGGGSANPGDVVGQTDDAMAPYFEATCDGYISAWVNKLSACDALATRPDIIDEITAGLKAVCMKGIDADHPMGSSTVNPATGIQPSSFEQVIRQILAKHSIAESETCHPYMVDFPPPYENQPPLSDDVVLTQQDECVCSKLTEFQAEKTQAGYTGTLSQFLQYQHGVSISQTLIDQLIAGCGSNCKFYEEGITVPGIFSCGSNTSNCIDCQDYSRLKSEFKTLYPGYQVIYANPGDDVAQLNMNMMFQQFMNSRTGLGKTWADYLEFEKTCSSYDSLWSCNKLDSIVAVYYQTHSDTLYGALCQASFTSFFNSAFSTAYSFAQIQALFMEHCGHLPDVCQAEMTCTKFQQVIDSFYVRYGTAISVAGNCQSLFEDHFNDWFGTDYTYAELQNLYNSLCGGALDVCSQFDCGKLQAVLDSWTSCHRADQLDDDCEGNWMTYFNGVMNTGLNAIQIDSLYRACGIINLPCQPPVTCKTLSNLLMSYKNAGAAACNGSGLDSLSVTFCDDCFVWFVNDNLGTSYSFEQIQALYKKVCGANLTLCHDELTCEKMTEYVKLHLATIVGSNEVLDCESVFTSGFNEYFNVTANVGAPYTFDQIMALYMQYCGKKPLICKTDVPVSCAKLQEVYQEFKKLYPQPSYFFGSDCQLAFTRFYNQYLGDTATWYDIQVNYLSLCGQPLDVCTTLPQDSCQLVQRFIADHNLALNNVVMPKQACIDVYSRMFNRALTSRVQYTWNDIQRVFTGCGEAPPVCDDNPELTAARVADAKKVFNAYYYDGLPANADKVFAEFFNLYYKTSFTDYSQLDQWAKDNFDVAFNIIPANTPKLLSQRLRIPIGNVPPAPSNMPPKLCGMTTMIPSIVEEPEDPCEIVKEMAWNVATEEYNNYVTQQLDNFDKTYSEKCLSVASQEIFTVRSQVAEYHFTLYYYDQAGNLVKTVPPKGVNYGNGEADIDDWYDQVNAARAAGTDKRVNHTLVTDYRYNTLNQVIVQKSPDAGISHFWYDRLGRLVVSQNAKQALTNKYSYTKYDVLGRITEVGQITASSVDQGTTQSETALAAWFISNDATREQITVTVYDLPAGLCEDPHIICQSHLRNRVSYTYLKPTASYFANGVGYQTGTYYTYDIHGNVDTLLHHYNEGVMQQAAGNAFKRLVYKYDLVSGKVNEVAYQPGVTDQFFHRYRYDADNKLQEVLTSPDSVYWERQAAYEYYKHGPLARTVLGDLQVQGIDYAYTLQGWLKGVNSNSLTRDIGADADGTSSVARDAYSFSLNYFIGDYKAIKANKFPFIEFTSDEFPQLSSDGVNTGRNLFNGNISSMMVNIPTLGDTKLYGYRYDQLNRLKAMNTYTGLNVTTNTFSPTVSADYKERVTYDGNGNIISYLRNANGSTPAMDNLSYDYYLGTNQLSKVTDAVAGSAHNDIADGQGNGNYVYDAIGNLVKDNAEGLHDPSNPGREMVEWTVYGKISKITKIKGGVTTVIDYLYDETGNRISQVINKGGVITKTWYVRDATGNAMAIYQKEGSADLKQAEVYLYGSSRLGVWKPVRNVEEANWELFDKASMAGTNGRLTETWNRGNQQYELSNHLGNVLVAVSDKLLPVEDPLPSGAGTVDYNMPDVVSASDYYPFGMLMPGRQSGVMGRYGFNGKENDNEVKGEGNSIDFGSRIYDPRLGRWLSVDPLDEKYPTLSPYNFVANSPINAVDPDGRLIIFINGLWGWPTYTGRGGQVDYWGNRWVNQVQDVIGDHRTPRYYDGSLGGTSLGGTSNRSMQNRIDAGRDAGYKDAKSIIANLDKDETIKIITNSMGAAFERGFTEGIFKYRNERSDKIDNELLLLNIQKSRLESQIGTDRVKELSQGIMIEPKTDIEINYRKISNKISDLNTEKTRLKALEVEMVIDLSPHQVDFNDPFASQNYYMTAGEENMQWAERQFVEEKSVKNSKYLGQMSVHHSSGADPKKFPSAKKRDKNNDEKKAPKPVQSR